MVLVDGVVGLHVADGVMTLFLVSLGLRETGGKHVVYFLAVEQDQISHSIEWDI